MKLPTIDPVKYNPVSRIQQQNMMAKAIKPFAVSQTNLTNTQAEVLGPFNISNGGSLAILSIVTNTVNENFRIGGNPYNIIFLEDTLATGSIIGYSVVQDYVINGPMGVPQFSPPATPGVVGGNTGDNLVFITELINNSGGAHDIYVITDCRVFNPIGGDSGGVNA